MKKYLYLLLLALVPAFTFTACGDDDELDPDDVNPEDVQVSKPTLKEDGNKVTLTYAESYGTWKITIVETYEFQGERLVRATISETFPTEDLAKLFMEEVQADPEEQEWYKDLSRSGKTVTYDATESYAQYSKQEIMAMLQQRIATWDQTYNQK